MLQTILIKTKDEAGRREGGGRREEKGREGRGGEGSGEKGSTNKTDINRASGVTRKFDSCLLNGNGGVCLV